MKNNFDLKGYMKNNQVGAYQQLNEMWYQDINQALGDFNEAKVITEEEMDEAKEPTFVIPAPGAHDVFEEAEYFQKLLKKAGVQAVVKGDMYDEEVKVYTNDEAKARKVIEKSGYQIGWNEEVDEMAGDNVKSLGTAGKMAHANTRTNLGRHRSSDILDKQAAKDHDKNTIKGDKAKAYKPPYMKEDEEDVFAGSDDANWDGRKGGDYWNRDTEWEKNVIGKEINGWVAGEEPQAGSIFWENPKYTNSLIYATPGWEGVNGIAVEVHDSEDGYLDEPVLQKVVGVGTEDWKTEEGYLALMAKILPVVEKMLKPVEMEDHGTAIDHDKLDNITKDHSEFEDSVYEEENPFDSIKTGIDKITMGDDDMGDDNRLMSMGGDQIKAGIESLINDGFDYREILELVKNVIRANRKNLE